MYSRLIQAAALTTAIFLHGAVAAEPDDANVIAKVNDDRITVPEVEAMVSATSGSQDVNLSPQQRQQVIEQMVQMTLLAQEARSQGLSDDPEVAAQIENARRLVLARTLVERMTSDDSISEDTLHERYNEQYGNAGGNTELHARHILVDEEQTARDLISRLDDGADFAELAKKNSTGTTASRGGDLGWFAPDQMVPAFSEAAQKLAKGEYTEDPIKTRFGWHIIKLEGTRESKPPAFEDVSEQLRTQIANQRISDRVSELREQADVEIDSDWQGGDGGTPSEGGTSSSGGETSSGQTTTDEEPAAE